MLLFMSNGVPLPIHGLYYTIGGIWFISMLLVQTYCMSFMLSVFFPLLHFNEAQTFPVPPQFQYTMPLLLHILISLRILKMKQVR